jgi:glutathione S-transferase
MQLYGDAFWISPYFFSCFVALKEKRIDFDVQTVALHQGAQRDPHYANTSVTARVPALEHNGFVLAESSAIVEYIEDTFPDPPVMPRALQQRARARQVMAWIRSDDTFPIRSERSTHTMFYQATDVPLSPAAEQATAKLLDVATRLVGNKTSMFDTFSIADADLAFMLQRLALNGHALPNNLATFVQTQWARPTIREFVDHVRPAFVPY